MEEIQRRDINELLTTGYFKTKRGKSPGTPSSARDSPSYLRTYEYDLPIPHRSRSRGRDERSRSPAKQLGVFKPPPKPTVEDEETSLRRESRVELPCYDPPLRGIIEQNPIILEAEVTKVEAARLQKEDNTDKGSGNDSDGNRERRFVLVPQTAGDTHAKNERDEGLGKRNSKAERERPRPEGPREERRERTRPDGPREQERREERRPEGPREERKEPRRPVMERKRSRQDLPSLETKIPREIPPQFRRSASAFTGTPRENETPKSQGPRTPSGEYFLSPDVLKQKDYFNGASSAPRQQYDAIGGRIGTPMSPNERHHSTGGNSSRPGTASSDKRQSGGWNVEPRSRRSSAEKLTRPQKLAEEMRKVPRQSSPHSIRPSSRRSSRDSTHSSRHRRSSSEEDSDSDRRRRRRHHEHRNPDEYDRHGRSLSRSNRSSVDAKRSSRFSTPLPSPAGISPSQIPDREEFERAETFPQTRRRGSRPVSPLSAVDRMTPIERPKSRQSNGGPAPKPQVPAQSAPYPESLPIPIPARIDLHSPGDTRRSPTIPQFEDFRSASARPPPPTHWAPPPFQPPSENLDKPMGSYRRFSEEQENGAIAPLPSCPRTTFTRGRNDWLTLPQCPNFDICPSCFNSTIAPTEFRSLFVPSPRRPPDAEILCDFGSSPWYRIAWLLTLKSRRRDLKLFYGLANISATLPPCVGKHEAVRQWHSIVDPKSGNPIRGFDVCFSCVKSIETLLPPLRGIFIRTDLNGTPSPRICDMRFDSKRFIQYFDTMETTADLSLSFGEKPDLRPLASLAKRLTMFPECPQDTELLNARWHTISQLPELTVCPECFDTIVWPGIQKREAIPLMFKEGLVRVGKASCGLYSERMRGVWKAAVERGDWVGLARRVRERRGVEVGVKRELGELGRREERGENVERERRRAEEEWRRWE